MKECLLNFVQDLFKFPWTREEFLRCNSFRESYDTFRDRIGDCSFEEYVEFFKGFNLECSTLEKSIGKLSDEQLEQVSGGGIGRFLAIPMVALTLLSGVSSVTGFAASIKAPKAVSFQAGARDEIQDEWAKTGDFVARAGDPWFSMLPLENEPGFDKYMEPVISSENEESENREVRDLYSKIDKIIKNIIDEDRANGGTSSNKQEEPNNISGNGAVADSENEGSDEEKKIKDVYSQIYSTVKVCINEAAKDNGNLPKQLNVAKHIYEWITGNMKYDNKLGDSDDYKEREYRARPDIVFENKTGICEGFAKLARLMMRMAKIPCAYVVSPTAFEGSPMDTLAGVAHAFNAIYVEKANGQKGWTLMDVTGGRPKDEYDAAFNKKRLHDNFPAAYDNEGLEYDNSLAMKDKFHQVKYIENENSYILNGVKYIVNDDSISVSSEEVGARLSLQIPESVIALNKKIVIGEGIEKYQCFGNERIDISEATNLESIDTDDSDVYGRFDEEGVLYYREDRSVADLKPGATVVIDRVRYYRDPDDCHSITVFSEDYVSPFLQVPPDLALNSKIKIGSGIYEYKCSGDEKIDISGAWNLQSIDTKKSHIYEDFRDGVLYYKEGYEGYKKDEGVADLIPGSLVKRGDFRYLREYNDCNSIYVYHVYNGSTSPATLKVPKDILALGLKIRIGSGINKYIASGNEVINILGEEYQCLGNEEIEW